jgi:pimeloyl-ACP methyl ester carboxylesterase
MPLTHERDGAGEPLVLIHGIGSHRGMWRPVLDALARERDVIALDLPGFGDSPPLDDPAPGPPGLAAAVAALLDELGIERAHVAGNSLGGGVALELARAGRARSATALSPVGFWSPREDAYGQVVLRATWRAMRAMRPWAPALSATPAARTLAGWHLTSRPWRIPPAEALAGARALAGSTAFQETLAGLHGWRFRAGPHELDCPVTVAWAQHDRILLPRQATRARRALPGARHVTLAGCGHVPTWDDPAQVARVLLEGSAGA